MLDYFCASSEGVTLSEWFHEPAAIRRTPGARRRSPSDPTHPRWLHSPLDLRTPGPHPSRSSRPPRPDADVDGVAGGDLPRGRGARDVGHDPAVDRRARDLRRRSGRGVRRGGVDVLRSLDRGPRGRHRPRRAERPPARARAGARERGARRPRSRRHRDEPVLRRHLRRPSARPVHRAVGPLATEGRALAERLDATGRRRLPGVRRRRRLLAREGLRVRPCLGARHRSVDGVPADAEPRGGGLDGGDARLVRAQGRQRRLRRRRGEGVRRRGRRAVSA